MTEAGHGDLKVQVVSPEAILFDAHASYVQVPAWDGLLGILPRHAPMLALLGKGRLTVRTASGEQRFALSGGFVQVTQNTVRVVAEQASIDGKGPVS